MVLRLEDVYTFGFICKAFGHRMSHLRYLAFVSCESLIVVTVLLLLVFHIPLHRSSVWQHRMVAEWKDCSVPQNTRKESGIYTIYTKGGITLKVYCELSRGDGWTV